MDKKLNVALKDCSSEHGFAMPIAVGLGFVIILIATTLVMRSQGDRVTASAQKQTAQSLFITEAGIARTMSGFTKKQAKSLLKLNHDPDQLLGSSDPDDQWDGLSLSSSMNSCDTDEASDVVSDEGTIGSGAGAGTYKLRAYRYDSNTQTGTLLIQGETNASSTAKSEIKVVFPVLEFPSNDITATSLMAKDIDLKKTDVTGSITCTDLNSCPINCSAGASTPNLAQLRDAIGANKLATITNPTDNTLPPVINVGSVELPGVPAVPAGANIISLGAVTSEQEIPSDADIAAHTPKTPYYFKINSINKAAILIKDTITDPVYLYVTGNIEQEGNNDIRFKTEFKTPNSGQIRIYGADTDGTLPASQTFQFKGKTCTMAFIHAPNANVGIDGGGSGCKGLTKGPNIYGAVWVKAFINSNPSNSAIIFEQPNLLTTLASSGLVPRITGPGNLTTWQRQEVTP